MEQYWIVDNEELDPQIQNLLNQYLLSLKLANKSELTIKSYRRYLERVLLDYAKPINEITSHDVLDYILKNHSNLKESSVKKYITVQALFFKFCFNEESMNDIIVKNRWKPKLPASIPKYLDKTELAKVRIEAEKLSLRERTIFEFLLSTGCRRSEASSLNVQAVDIENRTATVFGKGKKYRQVHFTESCALLLEEYLKTRTENTDPLFINKYKKRISDETIRVLVKTLGEKARLQRSIGPHHLRHTYSTLLLSSGAPLEFIADELGHSDLRVTRIYARILPEQLKNLYRRYME